VDMGYFRRLIAKAIMFRSTERIVSSHDFGGYRANIVTYTIAKLANATSARVDLEEIWRTQAVPPALERAIKELCVPVQQSITTPPRQANISEWCKRPECWARVTEIRWELPDDLEEVLLSLDVAERIRNDETYDRLSQQERTAIAEAAAVPKETWFAVSHWAKETRNLQPLQRGIAYSLGKLKARAREPSAKQAGQGLLLLQEAERLGFRVET
jgi:AIPR protein